MSCAESAPEMVVPVRPCGGALTWTTADQLAVLVLEIEDADVRAERVSTSRSVARVGLRPSASKMRFEPGKSAAAQRKKAAEEMSPGRSLRCMQVLARRRWRRSRGSA